MTEQELENMMLNDGIDVLSVPEGWLFKTETTVWNDDQKANVVITVLVPKPSTAAEGAKNMLKDIKDRANESGRYLSNEQKTHLKKIGSIVNDYKMKQKQIDELERENQRLSEKIISLTNSETRQS